MNRFECFQSPSHHEMHEMMSEMVLPHMAKVFLPRTPEKKRKKNDKKNEKMIK